MPFWLETIVLVRHQVAGCNGAGSMAPECVKSEEFISSNVISIIIVIALSRRSHDTAVAGANADALRN